MEKAKGLVRACVLAGYNKIHLDASMHCADDPDAHLPLDTGISAKRAAELCLAAEEAFKLELKYNPSLKAPVYVIGTEVPVPGGAADENEPPEVTNPEHLKMTVTSIRRVFDSMGLDNVWNRVTAVVAQPGVEFSDHSIHRHNREAAKHLASALPALQTMVFEVHSTDYQDPVLLKQMVEDGFAILKVGPALTFALREALFAIESMEREIL
jgi:D-tagatose-1,6-bisphosphate aldolase subunit GatZ/KbaZ